jgi:hypothetical protein
VSSIWYQLIGAGPFQSPRDIRALSGRLRIIRAGSRRTAFCTETCFPKHSASPCRALLGVLLLTTSHDLRPRSPIDVWKRRLLRDDDRRPPILNMTFAAELPLKTAKLIEGVLWCSALNWIRKGQRHRRSHPSKFFRVLRVLEGSLRSHDIETIGIVIIRAPLHFSRSPRPAEMKVV